MLAQELEYSELSDTTYMLFFLRHSDAVTVCADWEAYWHYCTTVRNLQASTPDRVFPMQDFPSDKALIVPR